MSDLSVLILFLPHGQPFPGGTDLPTPWRNTCGEHLGHLDLSTVDAAPAGLLGHRLKTNDGREVDIYWLPDKPDINELYDFLMRMDGLVLAPHSSQTTTDDLHQLLGPWLVIWQMRRELNDHDAPCAIQPAPEQEESAFDELLEVYPFTHLTTADAHLDRVGVAPVTEWLDLPVPPVANPAANKHKQKPYLPTRRNVSGTGATRSKLKTKRQQLRNASKQASKQAKLHSPTTAIGRPIPRSAPR